MTNKQTKKKETYKLIYFGLMWPLVLDRSPVLHQTWHVDGGRPYHFFHRELFWDRPPVFGPGSPKIFGEDDLSTAFQLQIPDEPNLTKRMWGI